MKKAIMYQLIELNEQKRIEQNFTVNKYARIIKLPQSTYYNLIHKNIDIRKTETKTFLCLLSQLDTDDMIRYIKQITA